MTEAERLFAKFPPFIQDYIYARGWSSLRPVQLEAARTILETDHNLLLSSATASGKTEAVFFPILAELTSSSQPASGVSVL
ncbi:MAG: DEAD/DEAH box helicase, partial [Clostridia bacterium]|nr:DEAD/DEAH box helicase [Clostridia bacterium]